MTTTVLAAFRDADSWRAYAPGEAYEAGEERVAALASLGLVSQAGEAGAAPSADMTAEQLRGLCAERGLSVPRKATKAQLLALLSE